MTTPERSPAEQRRSELRVEFMDLMRRFILEGAADASDGTGFAIVQVEPERVFDSLDRIAARGKLILSIGIPNPLEYDLERMAMTEEERQKFDEEGAKLLEEMFKRPDNPDGDGGSEE